MKHKGFIDLHTHGLKHYDTQTANPRDILKIAELQAKAGVAAILPTIYAAPIDRMRANMEAVRKAMEIQQGKVCSRGFASGKPIACHHRIAVILGPNLEGPFLKPVRCGALEKHLFIQHTMDFL